MKCDPPSSLALFLLLLSACQEGYYVQSNPNQGIVPMETGAPMPTGTRTVSAQFAQIVGDDDLRYLSHSDDFNYQYDQHDKIIKPFGSRISIRTSYQMNPNSRIGMGLSHSMHNLTLFMENTRYWKLGDRGTYASLYNILGASVVNNRYYSVETQELDHTGKSLMSEYYLSILLYHKLSEDTGFRWGFASPLTVSNPAYVRAGMTAGLTMMVSNKLNLHLTASRYSEAVIVSFDTIDLGDLRFIYPKLVSPTSRRFLNSPHGDISIGLQYVF